MTDEPPEPVDLSNDPLAAQWMHSRAFFESEIESKCRLAQQIFQVLCFQRFVDIFLDRDDVVRELGLLLL